MVFAMNLLGIFAKFWTPGQVKSRLAAGIGPEPASRLYRAFLATLLERFGHSADRRTLMFTPADRRAEFSQLAGTAWSLEVQAVGDLGNRMQLFFESSLQAGNQKIVLIGSDSPTLPTAIVDQAFLWLDDTPVVIGPSEDGGYYLIGVSGSVPPIFRGIEWSTPDVLSQTLAHLDRASIPCRLLPVWYDIDEAADLARLHRELAELPGSDAALLALRDELDRIQAAQDC